MTLMVPGKAKFSLGTSNDGGIGKTLDEIIKDRRVSQQKASKRVQKKSTNSDRSIATGKAKREAAARARRGLSQKKKPDKMEVEKEVKRQTKKTNVAKKKNEKKATGGKLPPKSSTRTKKKANAKEAAPQIVVGGVRRPSKKAVEAAVKGMEAAGFKVPPGHQVIMNFVRMPTPDPKTEKTAKGKGSPKKTTKKDVSKKTKGGGRKK